MQVDVTTPNSSLPTNSTGSPGWAPQRAWVQKLCMVTFKTSIVTLMSSCALLAMPAQLRRRPLVQSLPYHIMLREVGYP